MNNNIKNKRRGQIEAFGLAFIVILIVIGFFIYTGIKSQKQTPTPQKDYTKDKLASDFIMTIGNVNVENCEEYTVEELLTDCAKDKRILCGGIDSCTAINKSIYMMLNRTFIETNTPFRLYSSNIKYINSDGQSEELFNFSNRNCTDKSNQGKAGSRVIILYPLPNANIYLNICYK